MGAGVNIASSQLINSAGDACILFDFVDEIFYHWIGLEMGLYPRAVKQSKVGFGKSMLRNLDAMLLMGCLFLFILATPASAQHYTQWSLPEGAKARLGKGSITGDIVYSLDGTRLMVASSIGIWLYDAQTYQEVALLTGHTAFVRSVAFSPDGETLASCASWPDNTVRLWDAVTGQHKGTLTGHTLWVNSVAFSPDGKMLASGSDDNTVRLWDVVTGQHKRTLTKGASWVRSVAFSPDGKTLASGGSKLRLWDAVTGQHKRTLTGHTDFVNSVAFSPDGKTLASSSEDQTFRLWDVVTGQHKRTLTGDVSWIGRIVFSPDGKTLAGGSLDDTILLWDADTGQHKGTLTGHTRPVYSVAFSPDGKTLASGSWDSTVRLWDAVTGQHKSTLTGPRAVLSIAFSPDSQTLASGSWDQTIHLWDMVTGQHKDILTGHTGEVRSVAFSPDDKTLASGSEDSTIRLWDAMTGQRKQVLTSTNWVLSVAFSPDGKTLASGNAYDYAVHLWDVVTGRRKQTFTENASAVWSVAFSPDGKTLVSGADRPVNTIYLWDVVTGQHKGTLTGHTSGIRSIAFSSDGKTLASGSRDGTVLLWEMTPSPIGFPQIVGDVNRDGVVNILDLMLVGSSFGQSGQDNADVNEDGLVDITDLVLVAGAIGNTEMMFSMDSQALAMLTLADVQGWLTQAQGLDLTNAMLQRGITFLEQLQVALIPKETVLLPNYPNPFSLETWIPYHLAHAADVTLVIYDIEGALVRQLDLGHQPADIYTARTRAAYWDRRNSLGELVGSGIYFYQLRVALNPDRSNGVQNSQLETVVGDYSAMRKMVVLK